MNTAMYYRFLWKEYRTLRSFWLCMIGAVVGMGVIALVGSEYFRLHGFLGMRQSYLSVVTLAIATFYATGCSAAWFANEHEEGGYDFLQSRPAKVREIAFAKLTWLIGSSLMILVLGTLLTFGISTWKSLDLQPAPYWADQLLVACELVVWSILFSLLMKRTSLVLLAAIVAFFCILLITAPLIDEGIANTLVRSVIVVVVGGIATLAGKTWLGPAPTTLRSLPAMLFDVSRPQKSNETSRLVELQRHQAKWMHRFILGATAIFGVAGSCFAYRGSLAGGRNETMLLTCLTVLAVLPIALGLSAFASDQQRFARKYLCHRGTNPNLFWLSRHWASIGPLLLLVVTGCFLAFIVSGGLDSRSQSFSGVQFSIGILVVTVTLLVGYCVGQYASLIHSSRIVSSALAVCAAVCLWVGVVALEQIYHFASLILLLPLMVTLLWATWARSKTWLREADGWRVSAIPALTPWCVLLLGIVLVFCLRTFQFPLVALPEDREFVVAAASQARGWKANYAAINSSMVDLMNEQEDGKADGEPTSEGETDDDDVADGTDGYLGRNALTVSGMQPMEELDGEFLEYGAAAHPSLSQYSYFQGATIRSTLPEVSDETLAKLTELTEGLTREVIDSGRSVNGVGLRAMTLSSNHVFESLEADVIRHIGAEDFDGAWQRIKLAWNLTQRGHQAAVIPPRGIDNWFEPIFETGYWTYCESRVCDLVLYWAAHEAVTAEQLNLALEFLSEAPDRRKIWRRSLIVAHNHLLEYSDECVQSLSPPQASFSPGESIRYERIIRLVLDEQLAWLDGFVDQLGKGRFGRISKDQARQRYDELSTYLGAQQVQDWIFLTTVNSNVRRRVTLSGLSLHVRHRITGDFYGVIEASASSYQNKPYLIQSQFPFFKTPETLVRKRHSLMHLMESRRSVFQGLHPLMQNSDVLVYEIPAGTVCIKPFVQLPDTPAGRAVQIAISHPIPIMILGGKGAEEKSVGEAGQADEIQTDAMVEEATESDEYRVDADEPPADDDDYESDEMQTDEMQTDDDYDEPGEELRGEE